MTNIDKQTEDNFQERIIEMAKALSDLQDRAVIEYTPLVDDIRVRGLMTAVEKQQRTRWITCLLGCLTS